MMKRIWMNDGRVWAVAVLAGLLAVATPAQWIVDGSPWPDGGGGFSPDSDPDAPCADYVRTNHTGDVSIDGELLLTGGLTLGGVRRETWPDGGGTGEVAFAESSRVWVDWRNDTGSEDGSVYRPFSSVQAALDHIGMPADAAEYQAGESNRWRIVVSPGEYEETVTIPMRQYISIDLSAASIKGDVVWRVPSWRRWDQPLATLTIQGDSVRPAYRDASHLVTGIDGDLILRADADVNHHAVGFHNLHLIKVGVAGDVLHSAEVGANPVNLSSHVFLDGAQTRGIISTQNWESVALHARGWSMGHTGFAPALAGSGIGPIIGKVIPYTLQNTLISGLDLHDLFHWDNTRTALWHNVEFETGDGIDVSAVRYGVRLDTASYASWLAATSEGDRGDWHTDAVMRLTDGPITATADSPTLHVPKFIGDELFIHGGGGLVIYRAAGLTTNDWVAVHGGP